MGWDSSQTKTKNFFFVLVCFFLLSTLLSTARGTQGSETIVFFCVVLCASPGTPAQRGTSFCKFFGNFPPHPSASILTANSIVLAGHSPICTLPYMLRLSSKPSCPCLSPDCDFNLKLALSTPLYPVTKHAFYLCQHPAPQTPDFVRSILHIGTKDIGRLLIGCRRRIWLG